MTDLDLSWLPWQTRLIIESVGYGPALQLLRQRGGTRIRVPKVGDDCSMLELVLGTADRVKRLAAAFPDQEYVYLPKAKKLVARLRDEQIRVGRERGKSINELALQFDLTASYIKVILAEGLEQPSEPDLFGT